MTAQIRYATAHLSDEEAAALEGTALHVGHYDDVIGGRDVDVYRPGGEPLLIFRHNVLDPDLCKRTYRALRKAARVSRNRGAAAGGRYRDVKRDGTLSDTRVSDPVLSGTIGFYPRSAREPFCRTTAWTGRHLERWNRALPFFRAADKVFERELPDRHRAQMAAARQTPAEYVVPGTSFTTATVNMNYPTTVHRDRNDLETGFGVMSVFRAGKYEGCHLVFPQYRIGVDLRTGDVLLSDVHQWHGNSPFYAAEDRSERVSVICYFRAQMVHCLPPDEELRWAKRRAGNLLP